jgi:glycosyltransferase involved in cell wall biosynthesis
MKEFLKQLLKSGSIMIKLSLIITVYNRVQLLRKSLLSIQYQSFKPNEIVISDDGSDEDIIKGISDITQKYDIPITYVRQEKNGFQLAKCRNNGVKKANGEMVAFIDQDLVLSERYFETFVNNIKPNRFLTSYPIRLSEEQSETLSEEKIKDKAYGDIIESKQLSKIKSQYRKDLLSHYLNKLGIEKNKPKLRGGACAIWKNDYMKINGYDEKFIGWGNEDDDFRRRLYKAGVVGYNPHKTEFPMHLYHEPFHDNGERVNQGYNDNRKAEIESGNYFCEYGMDNPYGQSEVKVIKLN